MSDQFDAQKFINFGQYNTSKHSDVLCLVGDAYAAGRRNARGEDRAKLMTIGNPLNAENVYSTDKLLSLLRDLSSYAEDATLEHDPLPSMVLEANEILALQDKGELTITHHGVPLLYFAP